MAGERDEVDALQKEYDWILHTEVRSILKELHGILTEACRRFPTPSIPGEENLVKPEKFIMTSSNGHNAIKCMLTLMGDNICEAELSLRVDKQKPTAVKSNIYPDVPWKIQQVQDAGNHLMQALNYLDNQSLEGDFETGFQVLDFLDRIITALIRGRACLSMPKKKSLEDLIKNQNMKAFKPTLPSDTVLSFYVQTQKLVLAVYHLYLNNSQKVDISNRYQVECTVPWLNDTLALFTLALQLCQQLKDKITVFMQYEDEQVLLNPVSSTF